MSPTATLPPRSRTGAGPKQTTDRRPRPTTRSTRPRGAARPAARPAKPAQPPVLARRIRCFRLVLVVVLLALVARLVDVQVLHSAKYRAAARAELVQTVTVPALRGGLYDRNGLVLALSVPTKTVIADDFQVAHPFTEAQALAPLLGLPVDRLAGLLHERNGYVALARDVPLAEGAKVAAANQPGITLIDDSHRVVPNGQLAAPVLGATGAAGTGNGGLEYAYQHLLAGTPMSETLLESPLGVALPGSHVTGASASRAGTGLELSIDEPLQYETEQALAAQVAATHAASGVAVVMDVHTGQILAMANLVSTAPADGAGTTLTSTSPKSTGGPSGPVAEASQNLAVTQLYEPGSVFKLVTFSIALADGIVSPNTLFTVPDHIQLDGSTFHDAEPHATEQLTATQILAQSSNIGTSEIASDVGESRLLAQVQRLGFGQFTGLDFPGESPGLLAGPAQWEPTDLVSLPIGQVDAVTAQQVLDMYNAVADGGEFVPPTLVRAEIEPDGSLHAVTPAAGHEVMSPSTAAELTGMLEQVVDVGTGTSAVVPGYTVAGKTGTAQIPQPGKDSYIQGAYMASFVGFAPANNPVISAIVVLNRPTPIFGGTVAAPVFSKIMSYALHRYGIPTTPGAPTQGQAQGGSSADQAQDIT
ncbi:MAG TPA: penicillin-binding protein 2 [Acidimicrobiales bacterium]|nr:penicillin-binding protein 2 [Acidimicrobiales bacterium]